MNKWSAVNGVDGRVEAALTKEDLQALAQSTSDESCQVSYAVLCRFPSARSLGQQCQTCSHVAGG